jgi:CheY-like chemotaxis protein
MESKKLILLVEDDIFVKDIYNHKLITDGYEVAMAGDGVEAIALMEKRKPDLILLDIVMPHMDGKETLEKIKSNEDWKKIPIIMLTNLSEADDIEEAEALGADKYLIKSHFSPSEVSAKIKLMIG